MKNFLLLLAATGILFASCGKDDTALGAKAIGNRREVLKSHTWRLVWQRENGADVALKQCELDNIYVFSNDYTGYMDEGATKCDEPVDTTNPGDTVIVSKSTIANADNLQYDDEGERRMNFTWEVPGDQKELLIYNMGSSDNDPVMNFQDMEANFFIVQGSEYRKGKLVVYIKRFEAVQ